MKRRPLLQNQREGEWNMTVWIVTGLFALLAIPLLMGRGSFLIAGYNTASEEEKAKYNEKKLCRTMGVFCACVAVLTGALALIDTEAFALVYAGLLIAGVVFLMF